MVERLRISEERTMQTVTDESAQAPQARRMGVRMKLALCTMALTLTGVGGALFPGLAQGGNEIQHFEATPTTTQAGGHPDITTEVAFGNRLNNQSESGSCPNCSDGRAVTIHLPTGVIGNTHATPTCTLSEFSVSECPVESQIGYVWILIAEAIAIKQPAFNMEARPDEPGLIGFIVPIINGPAFITISARTGSDYGLDTLATGFQHLLPVDTINVRLWGTPASKQNDPLRFRFGWGQSTGDLCTGEPNSPCSGEPPVSSDAPAIPFLQNPTTCGVPLTASVDVLSYDGETTHAESAWPATTGCEQLAFNPALTAQPTTTQADTPTGLDVNLRAPQTLSEKVPSASELRGTVVTLPEGFSINPNAADGKLSCSDADANFGSTFPATCPETSKVGSIEIDSSALPAELPGAIYLAEPKPGNRYRLLITGDGFGTHIKLFGSVQLDPQTGRIVVSFKDLPQTPLQGFNFHFFGSERGLLATPTHCGAYEVKAEFEPWDDLLSNQTSLSSFIIDSGPSGSPCPGAVRPFNPTLVAGSADNTAGAYSNLLLRVNRADGDQNMVHINTLTPPGFSAKIAGIPYCPESAIQKVQSPGYSGVAELLAPSCPAASQVGTMYAGTGAGGHPLNSPGKVYLAGPYNGAPLSLMFVVPAVSGPYDLGNVAVRSQIQVNPSTAQITTLSDRIPEILDGVPLRIKYLHFDFDRSNFTLNPTNCDPFAVDGQLVGDQGSVASPTTLYQAANCADLGFKPKLGLKLKGSTKRRGHPALQAVLRAKPSEANVSRTQVAMPSTLLLDNSHIGTVCTRVRFAADSCPPAAVYGRATVETPLLDNPLSGPVYLRSSSHKLPDLVADLKGQIEIELAAKIDTVKGGLRATFARVPDAPVTKFVLRMQGGKKGLLINSASLCKGAQKATVQMGGQNGRGSKAKKKLQTGCGGGASKKHRRHSSNRGNGR
jgi:hypothetical protein